MGNEPHLEAWRSRLLRLSDSAFLDLMRNYLGKVETPYNKHDLINRLTRYLKGEDVQEAILGAIDEEDARAITAVALLSRPTLADLSDLFPESVSFLSLHEQLRNLEDRLLLFRDLDTEVLYLNPILEPRLTAEILDPTLLIEVRKAPATPPPLPWVTDGLLLALVTVAGTSVGPAVAKRSLTKREHADVCGAVPALGKEEPETVASLLRALGSLGLMEEEDGVLVPNLPVLRRFGDLEYLERLALLVAALAGEPGEPDEAVADAVVAIMDELSPDQEYKESALRVVHHLRSRRRVSWESLVEHLVTVGLLTHSKAKAKEGWLRPAAGIPGTTESPLTIQAGNEVTLAAGIRFAEGLPVAVCGVLRRHDLVGTYEITRESIAMADQRGFPIQELPGMLAELATRELPQSLAFNLDSWLSERARLSLTFAAVLTVDQNRRAFLDGNEAFNDYVLSTPAPGVYLLDPRREQEWRRLLADLGFPHLPRNRSAGNQYAQWAKPQSTGSSSRLRRLLATAGDTRRRDRGLKSNTKTLLKELDDRGLPPDVAKEMALRIEKKLILFSKQLTFDIGSRDRQEARGLDYVGKVRVIEQALREGDETLEVVVKRSSGEPVQMRLRPEELQKRGSRLLLKALNSEGEEVSLPVEKISLVRRLRGFLISR
jgi:hypothetical protein